MRRLVVLLLALALTCVGATAHAARSPYVDASVAGWQESPVYLSPEAGQLDAGAADELADRITGWRGDVFVTVLPATALQEFAGETEPEQAARFLDAAADANGELGVYLASFGGVGTYGAAYGTDDDVGPMVAAEVGDHTLGQSDQILGGVLDRLGAPGGEGGLPWVWVGVALLVLLGVVGGLLWLRGRRSRPVVRPSGEVWAGPADFSPSFRVQPDQEQTVEQRAALAREDVTRLGEEIDAEDLPTGDPAVGGHVQAALDAYAELSRRVDALTTDDDLRVVDEVLDYARWQLSCARARLAGTPPPPRRSPCFVDAAHGMSVADLSWAPPGGVRRPVPVCRACFDQMTSSPETDPESDVTP